MAITINGSGTITGLSAGGLPDGSVTNDDLAGSIADGKITGLSSSKLSGALPSIDGSNLTGISANDNTPRFDAYAGSVYQSLTSGTWTKAVWQGGVGMIDTDSAWDLTNHKFVIPSGEAGDYLFEAQTSFYGSTNDLRDVNVAIYKNGTAIAWGYEHATQSNQDLRHRSASVRVMETVAVGDYLEMYVKAGVGSGNLYINTNGNKKFHHFWGFKLA